MTSVNAERVERIDWREIDRELRAIAKLRGPIDAREAVLLCSASRHEIWRNLGKASFFEYLEEVLGYTPKCARERVRVALALDTMPALAEALAKGELHYSAVRELTRVATAETEAAWRETARGKNVRQIEELVSVHAPGDRPSDPPRPDLKPQTVRFEVQPSTLARLRQVQQILADELGGQLDDDALVAALCDAVLDGGKAEHTRARHQIMTTICEVCSQGWQQGGGRRVAVTATDVAIAECDAQRIGSDRGPGRAAQDVTPRVRRLVEHRDDGQCKVPGCRAARHTDVHHIVPRSRGGSHEADNLTTLCSGHHRALHEGALVITGPAPDFTVSWTTTPDVAPVATPHVGHDARTNAVPAPITMPEMPHVGQRSRYDLVVMKTEAIQAMTQLGFQKSTSRMLVEGALDAASHDITLEHLIRDALQRSRSS
jgi:hypothetical protein